MSQLYLIQNKVRQMQKQIRKLVFVLIMSSASMASAQNNYPFLGDITLILEPEVPPTRFDYIPDTFPHLGLPPHFVLETATSHYGTQRLILNTTLARTEALQQLIAILESARFIDFHALAGRELNNFIVTPRRKYSRSYCRDDVGYMTFEMKDLGKHTEITLSSLGEEALGGFQSCQHEANKNSGFGVHDDEIRQWMQDAPVLILPDETITITPPVVGDTYTSAHSFQSNTEIQLNLSMEQLYQILAAQVLQQGWTLDSESIGKVSASGHWLKTLNDKSPLGATVIVTQRSPSRFIINLRTTQLDTSSL